MMKKASEERKLELTQMGSKHLWKKVGIFGTKSKENWNITSQLELNVHSKVLKKI
jgi:hypothetical protein